jgi:uncharacterized membrane protein (UPF0127 family)
MLLSKRSVMPDFERQLPSIIPSEAKNDTGKRAREARGLYLLYGILGTLLVLIVYGCGAPAAAPADATATPAVATLPANTPASSPAHAGTPTPWVPPTALVGTPIPGAEATLTAAPPLQRGTLTITNSLGEKIDVHVEIADTPPSQELGLMFRSSMPPDAGMLFDFKGQTTDGFWMEDTILPLSIAFFGQDGAIVSIADMQPLDTTTVYAAGPYYYALETNQGFFRAHNINAGDKASFPVNTSVVVPGMPSVGK